MDQAEYQAWESAETVKLDEIARGIEGLRRSLVSIRDRLITVSSGVAVVANACVQSESTGGPLGSSHISLRQAVDHAVARCFSIEVLTTRDSFLTQLPQVTFPPQHIILGANDSLTVRQTGQLRVQFQPISGPFPEGPNRMHAEMDVEAIRGGRTFQSTMKLCIELHYQTRFAVRVVLATRPLIDPLPNVSILLKTRILRAISTSLASLFPRSVPLAIPSIGSLPSLTLFSCRVDHLPRFYLSVGPRSRYALTFLQDLSGQADRAYNLDTNLFRDVIRQQVQSQGGSFSTPIAIYSADNSMTFDVFREAGDSGKVEVRDPIFHGCLICFDWGIKVRMTIPVKVWFRQLTPLQITAQSRRNGGLRFEVVNQFPGNIVQLLPAYWAIKAAIESALGGYVDSMIQRDTEAFSDTTASSVTFSLGDPQSYIGIRY